MSDDGEAMMAGEALVSEAPVIDAEARAAVADLATTRTPFAIFRRRRPSRNGSSNGG
jgi:hypothetical protein